MQPYENMRDYIPKSSAVVFSELVDQVRNRKNTPEIEMGIGTLDANCWGLHKKELLIICGRPSHGKTSLSLQIAFNAAKNGHSTIFISLEMSAFAILERLLCNQMSIDSWRLRIGIQSEKEKFLQASEEFLRILNIVPFDVEDNYGKNEKEIEKILDLKKPECLVIDHVQMIPMGRFKSKQESVASMVQFLKTASIKYNCSIILNSQINRSGSQVGHESAVNHLKWSGELEEGADTVIQGRWVKKDDPQENDLTRYEIRILKQRHGGTGKYEISFNPSYLKFTEKTEREVINNENQS